MVSFLFQMKTYPCNRGLGSRYDIVAFSPPVHTETMKTIMKTQTKLDLFENARIRKRNDLKTHMCYRGFSWRHVCYKNLIYYIKVSLVLTKLRELIM